MFTATTWIAHILALHLSVPEPVYFRIGETWPTNYKAMITYKGEPGSPRYWTITYNEESWKKHNEKQKMYVIAHEVCHAAYEYDINWDDLNKKEQKRRHKIIIECADKIIRDHNRECR